MTAPVKTACPYCGVGCGIAATPGPRGTAAIAGDAGHPANFGRLCSKGMALGETLDLEDRLLRPVVDGAETDWGTALGETAGRLSRLIAEHGPDSIAFYVSGQLLTEDYYVANKLMKGFIGSANIDTNSRLCMASSVAGHQRAFGEDIVPGNYEDIEQADLVVIAGSNAAWCHPILYQRMISKGGARTKIVVIDPRRTATTDEADLHLPLAPGTDATLFNGLLAHLHRRGKIDAAYMAAHTENFEAALASAESSAPDAARVARVCGLREEDVASFFDWFAETEKTVTLYSQGINQSSSGTDKVNAIINCHLATARIGRPGMGPFSLTGQPNAMGGREVGGLATQLAAHMRIENAADRDRVQRFWKSPRIADKVGLKAVDLFRAIETRQVRAVWIMATNPLVSLPDAGRARAALDSCDVVIVSDCTRRTDTADGAHILLPAAAWGEKDGTVTNSERCISRQRAFLPPPGDAKPDWWIVCQVARRLGFESGFDYEDPAAIFREHAALSGFENNGSRAFDISGLAALSDDEYAGLAPLQWPVPPGGRSGTARLLGDGRFFTDSGKARFIAVVPRPPANLPDAEFSLSLNTGRTRDHWHTLTRSAKSPRLAAHAPEPFVEIHPRDAAASGVADGALARVITRFGEAVARARVSDDQRPGALFVPMHWSSQFAARGLINAAVNPDTDPVSGQPESKHTPARIEPMAPSWRAVAFSRAPLSAIAADYWVRLRAADCWRYEIAGDKAPQNWEAFARTQLGEPQRPMDWLAFQNTAAREFRFARFGTGRLEACLFVGAAAVTVSRGWLAGLFAKLRLSSAERIELISGRPGSGETDKGGMVCSCFGVAADEIIAAAGSGRARSADEIGRVLRAGTSCGTCRPEIGLMLRRMLSGPAIEAPQAAQGTRGS